MGGHQIGERGPNDDGYDEDGYDESQRAEILEATRDGPSDGTILTDLAPDLGEEPDAGGLDDLAMLDGELGEEDDDAELSAEDSAEDEVQADLDDDNLDDDDDLDDADEDALEP
jgi:DNA-directed RNA polymerase subunit delta